MSSKTKTAKVGGNVSDLVETHMQMFHRLSGPFGHGTPAKKTKKNS